MPNFGDICPTLTTVRNRSVNAESVEKHVNQPITAECHQTLSGTKTTHVVAVAFRDHL